MSEQSERPELAPYSTPDAPPYAPEGGWAAYWAQQPYGSSYGAVASVPVGQQEPAARRRGGWWALGAGVVAAAAVVAIAAASGATQVTNGDATTALGRPTHNGQSPFGHGQSPRVPTFPVPNRSGSGPQRGSGTGGNGTGTGGTGTGSASRAHASAAESRGVVDIYSVEGYQQAAAAGTGMIVSSNGEVLTNNHVINGATSIKVTVVASGKSYAARVVGTAPSRDIAVLKLQDASGLTPAAFANAAGVGVGDSVVGVGNAGGVGGTPSAAAGKVLALHRTITASDEAGAESEKLHDIIVTSAPIKSGDSGGPLYAASGPADGKVIGMDTAASSSTSTAARGFAIPITSALSVARQIESGVQTSSIHIGYPGFLGILMQPGASRAYVYQALPGGPAAEAGISAGDLITAVNGTHVSGQTQLHDLIATHKPGDRVSVSFVSQATGRSRTVTLTLVQGPAD